MVKKFYPTTDLFSCQLNYVINRQDILHICVHYLISNAYKINFYQLLLKPRLPLQPLFLFPSKFSLRLCKQNTSCLINGNCHCKPLNVFLIKYTGEHNIQFYFRKLWQWTQSMHHGKPSPVMLLGWKIHIKGKLQSGF